MIAALADLFNAYFMTALLRFKVQKDSGSETIRVEMVTVKRRTRNDMKDKVNVDETAG